MSTAQRRRDTSKLYIIVDFLAIDTKKFSFLECKNNVHGGRYIPIRYDGKILYVKYPSMICPFGISKFMDGGIISSYSIAVSFKKEYKSSPLYLKALELDEFFMARCVENSIAWGLGGSKTKPISRESIEGYDERGWNGQWRRLVKWSYKVLPTKEREYKPYPPRLDFGIRPAKGTFAKNTDTILEPACFDFEGTRLPPLTASNVEEVITNFSNIAVLAMWGSVTQGTYGASLKPIAKQIRIYTSERLADVNECLLALDEEEEEIDIPDILS